jgi:hypothetical protein
MNEKNQQELMFEWYSHFCSKGFNDEKAIELAEEKINNIILIF